MTKENPQKNMRIGVLDTGIGGLTVLREIERLMPFESVYYFGDNANCPYGNRTRQEIYELSVAMLDFLRERGVKAVAIACNTISALADRFRERYDFPIVSIIEAACGYLADKGLPEVGVFATEFTINQGVYQAEMAHLNPNARVHGISSRLLAGLVDKGDFDNPAIRDEVASMADAMGRQYPGVKDVVLGCTHYPIVQSLFESAAPELNFINPAREQAKAVRELLEGSGLLAENGSACHDVFTSGEPSLYAATVKRLDIRRQANIHSVHTQKNA